MLTYLRDERQILDSFRKKKDSIWFKMYVFTKPLSRAGRDTKSVFTWSLTVLNAEFSFT